MFELKTIENIIKKIIYKYIYRMFFFSIKISPLIFFIFGFFKFVEYLFGKEKVNKIINIIVEINYDYRKTKHYLAKEEQNFYNVPQSFNNNNISEVPIPKYDQKLNNKNNNKVNNNNNNNNDDSQPSLNNTNTVLIHTEEDAMDGIDSQIMEKDANFTNLNIINNNNNDQSHLINDDISDISQTSLENNSNNILNKNESVYGKPKVNLKKLRENLFNNKIKSVWLSGDTNNNKLNNKSNNANNSNQDTQVNDNDKFQINMR